MQDNLDSASKNIFRSIGLFVSDMWLDIVIPGRERTSLQCVFILDMVEIERIVDEWCTLVLELPASLL